MIMRYSAQLLFSLLRKIHRADRSFGRAIDYLVGCSCHVTYDRQAPTSEPSAPSFPHSRPSLPSAFRFSPMIPSRMFRRLVLPSLALLSLPAFLGAETLEGVSVEVVARRQTVLAGRTLVYLCIRPPALPAAIPSPAPVAAPTEEVLQAEALRAAKAQVNLGFTALVYQGTPTVTELSWSGADGRVFRAFSNVDFSHLVQFGELETATTIYSWLPCVSEGDPAALPEGVRPALAAAGFGATYLFEGGEAEAQAEADALEGLDYLLAHYQVNEAALVAATALREAAAAEQARQAALAAAQPKTETLFFWKIENPEAL